MQNAKVKMKKIELGTFFALAILLWLSATVAAEDTVYLGSASGGRGYTKLSGQVIDYSGRQLVLETSTGKQTYPADRVVKIETQYTPDQVEADTRTAGGDFASALALYGQARNVDQRPWVRREITAKIVRCHRALEQWQQAGEEFMVLVQADPDTPYFDCIPLGWVPSQPSPQLERSAEVWLARDDLPAAVLLGASHLMNTSSRAAALAKLSKLATDNQPKIAPLAVAQVWRAAVSTVDAAGIDRWQQAIQRMPEPLRGGPYYVLGEALAQRGQWEKSALALMRATILYSDDRTLAARSLLDAGAALEKIDRTSEAAAVYRELIENHPNARDAATAHVRMEDLRVRDSGLED